MKSFGQTGDAAAAPRFAAKSSGVKVALAIVLLSIVGVDGHISNQLEDFLLQVFGGLQLASHPDSAATTFRNEGAWQKSLPSSSCTDCDVRNPRVERQDESHPHIRSLHANGPSSCKCCSRQQLRASGAAWVACRVQTAASRFDRQLCMNILAHVKPQHALVRSVTAPCAMWGWHELFRISAVQKVVGFFYPRTFFRGVSQAPVPVQAEPPICVCSGCACRDPACGRSSGPARIR